MRYRGMEGYSPERVDLRATYVNDGLSSGRFTYTGNARIKCTHCGRSGYMDGYWVDSCLIGHPYVCACGRAFSTKQAIATHRRHEEG